MKTITQDMRAKAPVTDALPLVVIRRPATHLSGVGPRHLVICAECRYAQLHAEEPWARCMCSASRLAMGLVFAGQPACVSMSPRDEGDLSLAWCTPGLKTAHARFVQPRPRTR